MRNDIWKIVDSSSPHKSFLLLRGVRGLLHCDEAETIAGIARYVMSQYPSLRIGAKWMARTRRTPLPGFFALLGGLTRFLEVHTSQSCEGGVWVARLGNERRAIESAIQPPGSEMSWTELKFGRRLDSDSLQSLARLRRKGLVANARRIFRLARLLHRRYEFFRVLRVIDLIAYYSRYLEAFRQSRFQLAIMSSHSNPHGIAFNLAARKSGVPVVLVTHGMPVRPVAKLKYNLALVHCEAARQTYFEEGSVIDRVLIHGRSQQYFPMPEKLPTRLVVGIFLCKDVNENNLRAVIDELMSHPRVSQILVRPHPKNLWLGLSDWITSQSNPKLQLSTASSEFDDIAASDIVLGGNSSVLVEAVTAGRPSGYVAGIDYGTPDLHAFVARGLIYPMDTRRGSSPTVREGSDVCHSQANALPNHLATADFEKMLCFYQRPEWPDVLRRFANIDESEAAVSLKLAAFMRELAEARP